MWEFVCLAEGNDRRVIKTIEMQALKITGNTPCLWEMIEMTGKGRIYVILLENINHTDERNPTKCSILWGGKRRREHEA